MSDISRQIWDMKYRLKAPDGTPVDHEVPETWARVALAAAQAEAPDRRGAIAALEFAGALAGHRFLPAGRILAGAGTERNVTLFNCFVMGRIEDDMGAHLRPFARGGADPAAGRRHRLRFLDAAPQGRAGEGRGRRRLRARSPSWRCGTRCAAPS